MFCRSSDFRPAYAHLGELRAFAPPGAPMLAATATVTDVMRNVIVEVLEMTGCAVGRELTVKGDASEPLVSLVLFLGADLTGLLGSCSLDTCFW